MATNRLFRVLFTCACVGAVAAAVSTNLNRRGLAGLEKSSDDTLIQAMGDRNSLVGFTRSVYLPGYGVVFSVEMDVAPGSTPNPFDQNFTKERIARIKETKRQRIAQLRGQMQKMMAGYADSVQVNDAENIAMAVTLLYSRIEDTEGMPKQIVMWAPRSLLKSGNGPAIAANLKVQELF